MFSPQNALAFSGGLRGRIQRVLGCRGAINYDGAYEANLDGAFYEVRKNIRSPTSSTTRL